MAISDKIKKEIIDEAKSGKSITEILNIHKGEIKSRTTIYKIIDCNKEIIDSDKEVIAEERKEVINTRKRMGINKYYTFVVYADNNSYDNNILREETKEKIKEKLQEVKNLCAILHDKDCDSNGEIKKSHYHIILYYPSGVKYDIAYEDICNIGIFDKTNIKAGELVSNINGMIGYMTHSRKKDINKYQYSIDELITGEDFNIEEMKSNDIALVMDDIRVLLENDLTISDILDIQKYYKDDKDRLKIIAKQSYAVTAMCKAIKEKRNKLDILYKELTEKQQEYKEVIKVVLGSGIYKNEVLEVMENGLYDDIIKEYILYRYSDKPELLQAIHKYM